jgi:hypothetical protein
MPVYPISHKTILKQNREKTALTLECRLLKYTKRPIMANNIPTKNGGIAK